MEEIKMLYDYKPLRTKIAEQGYTIATLARKVGIAPNVLRMKLHCWKQFTIDEIRQIAQVLGLSNYEMEKYFFTYKFQKKNLR